MNYMKQIAEMLELEWDDEKGASEEFEVACSTYNPFTLTVGGLKDKDGDTNSHVLVEVLANKWEIKKLPKKWKPKYGEAYYVPLLSISDLYASATWNNYPADNYRYDNNLGKKQKKRRRCKWSRIRNTRQDR